MESRRIFRRFLHYWVTAHLEKESAEQHQNHGPQKFESLPRLAFGTRPSSEAVPLPQNTKKTLRKRPTKSAKSQQSVQKSRSEDLSLSPSGASEVRSMSNTPETSLEVKSIPLPSTSGDCAVRSSGERFKPAKNLARKPAKLITKLPTEDLATESPKIGCDSPAMQALDGLTAIAAESFERCDSVNEKGAVATEMQIEPMIKNQKITEETQEQSTLDEEIDMFLKSKEIPENLSEDLLVQPSLSELINNIGLEESAEVLSTVVTPPVGLDEFALSTEFNVDKTISMLEEMIESCDKEQVMSDFLEPKQLESASEIIQLDVAELAEMSESPPKLDGFLEQENNCASSERNSDAFETTKKDSARSSLKKDALQIQDEILKQKESCANTDNLSIEAMLQKNLELGALLKNHSADFNPAKCPAKSDKHKHKPGLAFKQSVSIADLNEKMSLTFGRAASVQHDTDVELIKNDSGVDNEVIRREMRAEGFVNLTSEITEVEPLAVAAESQSVPIFEEDETLELIFDAETNSYYDPKTGKYYELEDSATD
ncbi:hypothetical protein HDU84_003105 [Entophlyctis sp. JEL0112]|nr:hypothetical protein HDU84_003105 [Entophlyctis sp. JEL0112]